MTLVPVASPRSSDVLRLLTLSIGTVLLGLVAGCDLFAPSEDASTAPPRALTSTEKQVVASDQRFGLRLFRTAFQAGSEDANANGNVLLSPVSVSMALGMTLNGARGETRTAMEEALEKQDLSPAEINDAYRGLIDLLEGLDPTVEMALANAIWYRRSLPVRPAFIDTNEVHFDAEVTGLDFSDPDASKRMNDWVKDKTQSNIERIVPSEIPKATMMYLMNATYFKGSWRAKFDPEKTEDAPFHLADGSTTSLPMMERTENVRPPYLQTEEFTAVDLAYGDSLFSMTVLLPREKHTVADVVDDLDAEQWSRITEKMRPRALRRLAMPRFTVRYEKTLNDILSALGMTVAFTHQANFRGIADTSLALDKVKHKTFLRVDEDGTEASAATSVGVGIVSADPAVVVDRPFVVAIRENHSGTILFLGAVMNPSAA